jgi:pimeloyl-ACP methyl ester carboxylesterase
MMELFFRKLGSGDPLVILHGLYGSSDNWYSIGRSLAHNYKVYLVDQRNHGNSPHSSEHNYRAMCNDLTEFFDRHNLTQAIILGHSMGGKTALAFGMKYPEEVKKMIVVDISPFGYDQSHSQEATAHHRIIQALMTIQPETLQSRAEADMILKKSIAPSSIRQFLLKNLKHDGKGRFYWSMNIPAIAANMAGIFDGVVPHDACNTNNVPHFPLLFIKGEYSGYIKNRDEAAIRKCFPWSQIITVTGSGHWLHAEQPRTFLNIVADFLKSIQQ